jgi:type IV pilus assembly protein PilA
MKSTKCPECGFVGWSDAGNCKSCGASLVERHYPQASPVHATEYSPWSEPNEGVKKGLAIFALVLGIISFFTFGLLGVGAVTGIIVAAVAMGRVTREPSRYGGRGMAIAGLVLSITSLVSTVPIGIIAAIAIPNLLASRRAANESSAINSLRRISSAEVTYQSIYQKYGSLDDLASEQLIDPTLASGVKNGYRFSLELTASEYSNPEGFKVKSVPLNYQSSGRRSFFIDETSVIRASDNHGGPSSEFDPPLASDYDFPTRTPRRGYGRDVGY